MMQRVAHSCSIWNKSTKKPEPPKKSPASEPATTKGEGNLESEQAEVMRAGENDETIENETNLIA